MPPEAGRAWFTETHVRMNDPLPPCSARDLTVGGVPCRLLNEAAGPGRIVLVHGGGWTFGNPATHERCGRLLALDAAMPVLLPDYRLAPEHPCPAAIEDILAVLAALPPGPRGAGRRFLRRQRRAGGGAGWRAAGHAVALVRLLRADLRHPQPPGVRRRQLRPDHRAHALVLEQLAGRRRRSARGVPLDGPMEKLPRTHLLAAGLDCLRDDTLILSGKLAAAGIRYRLDVLPGLVHGFLQMTALVRPAREAITTIADEIRHTLNRE